MHDQGLDSQLLNHLIEEVQASRKYRGLSIPEETLRDLLAQELTKGRSGSAAQQAVREKLHNIMAPYLGDPDYEDSSRKLTAAAESGQPGKIKEVCLEILGSHASTRERIPLLDTFYQQLWQVTGQPEVVLDLACALHPFGLPWMGLNENTRYYAYDLHTPRIELINHFLLLLGRDPLGVVQDILVTPPTIQADVAIFFKEAHRFEQRQHGATRSLLQALNAKWLLVSLPASDLKGHHSLVERQRKLINLVLTGFDWSFEELQVGNELVFCIRKS